MNVIYPPNPLPVRTPKSTRVFLAGSIEMGKAEDWQSAAIEKLDGLDVDILNPRRKDWDSSWKQTPDFKPFRDQVLWEQSGLAVSDVIIFNFLGDTKSPITLLELGIVLGEQNESKSLFVCCPKSYFRHGNVVITCERYGVNVYETMDEVIPLARSVITNHNFLKRYL